MKQLYKHYSEGRCSDGCGVGGGGVNGGGGCGGCGGGGDNGGGVGVCGGGGLYTYS